MKKKKRFNFILKICSLLLLGIISITLLGSWTYEPQSDSFKSDNLVDINNYNLNEENINISINNNSIFVNGTFSSTTYYYIPLKKSIDVQSSFSYYYRFFGTYSRAFAVGIVDDSHNNVFSFIGTSSNYDSTNRKSFANTFTATYFMLRFSSGSYDFSNINFMLSSTTFNVFENPNYTYINSNLYTQLQTQYNQLQTQYNQLQNSYDLLNSNYEFLENQVSDLQSQITSLQNQLSTLQSQYENLEIDYQEVYDNYQNLLSQYNDLQSQYNQLQQDYDNLESAIKPFVFDYSKIVIELGNATQTGDNFVANTTLTSTQVASYFDEFGGFDLEQLYNDFSGYGTTYNSVKFYVPDLNLLYFNVMFSFRGIPDLNYRLLLVNSMGESRQFSYDVKDIVFDNENSNLNFTILGGIIHSNSTSINDFIFPVQYVNYSQLILTGVNVGATNVYKITFGSNNSYNMGFQDGYTSIKGLYDNQINQLRSSISQKDETIRLLNAQIEDLNNQVLNSIGWKPLFFAIADTPFKVVSNILGFELFGVNLFNAFVGIITALALIWLIKKLLGR